MIGRRFGTLLFLGALFLPAQELRDYEPKVTEFTLANGLHFILLERHQFPVISFHTSVNVGYTRDPAGATGMTHLLERLAFKGTETVGSRNWSDEAKALAQEDDTLAHLEAERNLGDKGSPARRSTLEVDLQRASDTAQSFGDPAEFRRVLQENGAVDITCRAKAESLETAYSLPSNRMELWFLMESDRLAHPVFRDFYRERDALAAENRDTVDSRPLQKLHQALLATAFAVSPYRNPALGWASDIPTLRRSDAKAFYDTYFVPANMVIGIVGDVDPANARRLADKYFAVLPNKPAPASPHFVEPAQLGPKTVTITAPVPPLLLVGYKRPSQNDRSDLVFDVIRMILAEGRSSWTYKDMVEQKRIAQTVDAQATVPSGRYTTLFTFTIVPARDHTIEENQAALEALLNRLGSQPVDEQTLTHIQNQVRTRTAVTLGSNRELAFLLTSYAADYGDWRKLFSAVDDVRKISAQDIQRAALQYFTPANRTSAYLTNAIQPATRTSGSKGAQ